MTKKVLVLGGGIGGLAAACCLLQSGYDVELYEQAPVLGEVGAGIQISANAMHVLNHLGLSEEIARLAVYPKAYVFRMYDTAEIIGQFSLADEHARLHGARYSQLHRADLHGLLATKARSIKASVVHLDKKAIAFDETDNAVTLLFADGTTAQGDLLVGADGMKSVIRNQIVGTDRPIYTGDAAWRLTVPTERLPQPFLDKVMSVFMGPGAHVVCYYLRGGTLLNFVGLVETDEVSDESWTARLPWQNLKAAFQGWHSDIQTVIDASDRDECFRWSLFRRPVPSNWSTKRVTMLGDAVHSTLPYLAQGAAMAVEDAAVLVRALSITEDVALAVQIYQRNRIGRTTRIVDGSSANRDLFHLRNEQEMRQIFASRNQGDERNQWLYSYNPLSAQLS